MIVLDTNVVSELLRPAPDERVLTWLDRQRSSELWLSAVSAAELAFGVERLPHGRRKIQLREAVRAVLSVDLGGRLLPLDRAAAEAYGSLAADLERQGLSRSIPDVQIAATCRSRGATLATRNVRDFAGTGLDLVNPWELAG